ncbi:MAG: hypothetical protein ABGY29_16965 [bacterium]
MNRNLLPSVCVLLVSSSMVFASLRTGTTQDGQEQVLDASMHHFGDDSTPEWPEAPPEPEGSGLSFEFESTVNRGEWSLAFFQRHISNTWKIEINGKTIATVRKSDALIESYVAVPPQTLVDGTNHFKLTTDSPSDDITFGRIRLLHTTIRDALNLVSVSLVVREETTLNHIPARVTVTNPAGQLLPIYFAENLHQATREGVVYTDTGAVHFEVPAGDIHVVASRGPEWSIASLDLALVRPIEATFGGLRAPDGALTLAREVDTTGFISCDTHIHTLTFSGHGDSSVEERMVTLAGEGVELAISTDHNHNTDYAPYQERMGLGEHFTTVVGNEVTTPIGHFNAFPLNPEDEVPPHDLHDMVQLVDGMRAAGAKVVILNHPRWPSHAKGPFGVGELNHYTGDSQPVHGSSNYPFDAMELVNSCTSEDDPMLEDKPSKGPTSTSIPIRRTG